MLGKIFNQKTILLLICVVFLCTVVPDLILATARRPSKLSLDSGLEPNRTLKSSIAKVSMLYGERNPLYERALAGHVPHNNRFGYEMYVLREQTLPGYWSKPAYILNLLLQELARPKGSRLEWLV